MSLAALILSRTLKGDIGRAFPQSVMQEVCKVVYRMPVDSTFDEVCTGTCTHALT